MRSGWWIVFLFLSGLTHAASFDCAKARTSQEKTICSSLSLSKADEKMAAAYQAALAAAPAEMKEGVRADQRAWLKMMPLECPPGRQRFDQDIVVCLQQEYDLRIKDLRKLVVRKRGVTFVWRSIVLMNQENPPEDDSVREARADIDVIPGYGTLTVSWPQTNATTGEWRAWNQAILTEVQRLASQGKAAADGQWHTEWADDDDGDLTVTIGVVDDQLISTFVDRWGFRGAHPWETSLNLNWMLKEQRKLRSDDVFQPNSQWEQAIEERCMKDLVNVLGQHYEDSYAGPQELPRVLHKIILDPENWQLDPKGLTIVFQDYSIAPRMLHPGPVTISWNDLNSYLQPGFIVPR